MGERRTDLREEHKSAKLLESLLRASACFAAVSFLWLAFLAAGPQTGKDAPISDLASQLLSNYFAIAFFSLVYGFSNRLLHTKKLSSPVKYTLHILVNYGSAMICFYSLVSITQTDARAWTAVLLLGTFAFFVYYGIVSLVIYLVKKKLCR